jgi:type IV secretion system protein VirB4
MPVTSQENKGSKNNETLLATQTSSFIPYACHYDKDTILTKNGELLQTLEIKGLSYAKTGNATRDIREQIRACISETIKSSQFSIYFHTMRHAINLDDAPEFPSYMSQKLHEAWVNTNSWNKKHVNNLYVTIVRKGMNLNFTTYLKKPFIDSIIKTHDESLVEAQKELDFVMSHLLTKLDAYSPTKLGMVKDNEKGYCSTILKFFNTIIQIERADFPIEIEDLSRSLAINKVSFGYNALEITKANGKFFAAIFSIKENNEINIFALERFLQMPQQMVITQSINFISNQDGYKEAKYQNHIIGISGDSDFADESGLSEINEINAEENNIFCNAQTTVMIVADNLDQLKRGSIQLYKTLSDLGLPAVREDLNLEHCFWSQLPANFAYIVRRSTCLSKKMGSFALLNNLPFGAFKSKWGKFVCLFDTVIGTPYFFNFHVKDNGHTIIVGDDNKENSVLVNFLFSEASKFNTRFIYLDAYKRSKLYMEALGVTYKIFNFDKGFNELKMNPLLLKDSKSNRSFLKYWFVFLLNKYSDLIAVKTYLPVIEKAIEVLYSLPEEQRRLKYASEFFIDKSTESINKEIISNLQEWVGDGAHVHIFDNDSDCFKEKDGANIAIDISDIYDTSIGFNLPMLSYILHIFKENFTGDAPSALCIAEGSRVFNSIYFEKNLKYIFDDLMDRNAIILTHASFCSEKVNWSEKIAKVFNTKCATQIFMSDNVPSYNNTVQLFNLTEEEKMYLQSLSPESKQFLLRQSGVSLVLKLDLSLCTKELGILSGNHRYVEAAANLMETKGSKPNDWLPLLYESELE